MSTDLHLDSFTATVLLEARKVRDMLRKGFSEITHNPRQESEDVETQLDRAVARHWHDFLKERYSFIGFDAEEKGFEIETDSGYLVRVDSIDGSKLFKAGIDIFSSTFSLTKDGKVVFGMVVNPISGKTYHAIKDRGAFLNERRINVGDVPASQGYVFGEAPGNRLYKQSRDEYDRCLELMERLFPRAFRLLVLGMSVLPICWVAEGAGAGFLDLSGTTKLYDVEAPLFIARMAGARITDLTGEAIDLNARAEDAGKKKLRSPFVVANPVAHEELMAHIGRKVG